MISEFWRQLSRVGWWSALAALCLHSQTVSFLARRDFQSGSNPQAVAAADFDNDGKLDLAVVNSLTPGSVTIMLGNGDGTFRTVATPTVQNFPRSVAVADLNSDGALDLIVSNRGNNNVSVLLGNGDGTFQNARNVGVRGNPWFVTVADFNDDGTPDLAVTNNGNNDVSILLGNGDGTFQGRRDFAAGPGPTSIAVGDFNGDGKLDLAVADINSNPSRISLLLGNGDGTMQPARTINIPNMRGSISVVAADFNRDGKLDLAVANQANNNVSVLLGNGDGSFAADCSRLRTSTSPLRKALRFSSSSCMSTLG